MDVVIVSVYFTSFPQRESVSKKWCLLGVRIANKLSNFGWGLPGVFYCYLLLNNQTRTVTQ